MEGPESFWVYINYMSEREDEDRKFAEWLKTRRTLPGEIGKANTTTWDNHALMNTMDTVHRLTAPKNEK